MAISAKDEQRALDAEEKELVARTHHPAIRELSDSEVSDLVGLIRSRRDKARTLAHRRRREMRGKAAPQGATPSAADEGSRLKLEVLSAAMRRVNGESERRARLAAKTEMVENAQAALAARKASKKGKKDDGFNSRTAHEGMREVASGRRKNLIRPSELGRQRQAAKVAQAKRDSR